MIKSGKRVVTTVHTFCLNTKNFLFSMYSKTCFSTKNKFCLGYSKGPIVLVCVVFNVFHGSEWTLANGSLFNILNEQVRKKKVVNSIVQNLAG